jgi:hypothetical protein
LRTDGDRNDSDIPQESSLSFDQCQIIVHALCFRVSQDFIHDGDPILESINPHGGAVMAQGVNDEGCRHDTESEVREDVARDKGQRPEQDRGLEVTSVAHVDGEA